MKSNLFALLVAILLGSSAFTTYQSVAWQIAEGYAIKFESKNPRGIFNELKGDIVFDENNLAASKFDMEVAVGSISTGNGVKNKHARSDKWFDAEKFPLIRFSSSEIRKTTEAYEVTGTLEIRDVKKEITFPFTFEDQTFRGGFMINRLDYGIGTVKGMAKKAATDLQVDIMVPVSQ
ncbi:MAG: YceI family protein [Bacteroidota bacterium]